MKKGQTGIALVILGVVAIIAVIGLVLLFTRASQSQGALLTDLSIGNSYNGEAGQGISPLYPTTQYISSRNYAVPVNPERAYPAYMQYSSAVTTKGTRVPAFVISGRFAGGGFASLEDIYGCERDLTLGPKIGVPHDMFNCYAVPNKGQTEEVEGWYPPASSASARPPEGDIGKTGGDMYCYANSLGAEQQVADSEDKIRENILITLVDGTTGVEKYDWGSVTINGKRVPVCWVSAKTFPFPQ